jgi:hypothetical protein
VPKYKSSQIFLYWDDELTKKTNDMNDDFVMDDSFADFVNDLTTNKANENACSIDNPDCEGCGS